MVSRVNEDAASAVQAVYAALADHDGAKLRPLLHPYLHWVGSDGVTIRGRTQGACPAERPGHTAGATGDGGAAGRTDLPEAERVRPPDPPGRVAARLG